MEEAERFDWLIAMNAGKVLAAGSPAELKAQTGARRLEDASSRCCREAAAPGAAGWKSRRAQSLDGEPVIVGARPDPPLRRFHRRRRVSFTIERGEIFGFVGSNGCGKTTTMKMLTGLLPPSAARRCCSASRSTRGDIDARRRVGYMSQSFSLYTELTVRQNLDLHARLFHLPAREGAGRASPISSNGSASPTISISARSDLPLGIRQRLSLAVASCTSRSC